MNGVWYIKYGGDKMSFKYEFKQNGKVVRTISKCWTALLFVEVMKDIMTLDAMGKDTKIRDINFKISRQEDNEIEF